MDSEDRHKDLLERATAALERIDATLARQTEAFDRQAESHERMMRRMDRRDAILVEAIGDIDLSLQRNTDRLGQMTEQMTAALSDIREQAQANTQAVLSVLDRLGPATG